MEYDDRWDPRLALGQAWGVEEELRTLLSESRAENERLRGLLSIARDALRVEREMFRQGGRTLAAQVIDAALLRSDPSRGRGSRP